MADFRRNSRSIRYLTLTAIFTALSVVLTRLVSVLAIGGSNRFGLGLVPIHLTGFLLGPFWGALSGLMSDLIGIMINPMGPPFWGITVTTVLQGFLPGLVLHLFRDRLKQGVAVSMALCFIFLSLLLQSYWLSILLERPYTELIALRALPQLGFAFIYTMIELPIVMLLKHRLLRTVPQKD